MHQDRNNGNWPELKRKKQRFAFDDDHGGKSHEPIKKYSSENERFLKMKKINANNLTFKDDIVMNDFTETE